MRLSSTAFDDGGMLPPSFTCDGAGISPPLEWTDVPDGTLHFALICEDPDASSGVFTHWLLYNLPGGSRELEENVPRDAVLSIGTRQGLIALAIQVMAGLALHWVTVNIVTSLNSTR